MLKSFKKLQVSVVATGSRLLYDASFNVGYHVVFSQSAMYRGEEILGDLGDVYPVHIVAHGVITNIRHSMYSIKIMNYVSRMHTFCTSSWMGELKGRQTCTYTGQQAHRHISTPWTEFKPWTSQCSSNTDSILLISQPVFSGAFE
jgi:hypothetical protein